MPDPPRPVPTHAERLSRQLVAVRVLHLPQVGSTSSRLKELLAAGQVSEPTLLIADEQTAGRGRRTRVWVSAPPENAPGGARARDLAMTLALPLPAPDARASLLAGVLAADAVTRATRLPLRLKWPNDLLAGEPPRKAGGLLLEHTGGWLLAGIGINVNSTPADFPPDLAGKLTTLSAAGRKRYDVELLAVAVTRALLRLADPALDAEALMARWHELDCTSGVRYTLLREGKQVEVCARAVLLSGELLLTDGDGQEYRIGSYNELEPAT